LLIVGCAMPSGAPTEGEAATSAIVAANGDCWPCADDDGDGLHNGVEQAIGTDWTAYDGDGDGLHDGLDDLDGDGLTNLEETGTGATAVDTDADGIPNASDPDDDGDAIPTLTERQDAQALPATFTDADGDGAVNWLDTNADGSGQGDSVELRGDVDEDGILNYVDARDDLACASSQVVQGEACVAACGAAFHDQGGICLGVGVALEGLRWELPCIARDRTSFIRCYTTAASTKKATIGGVSGKDYRVTLRLRGVVELHPYAGGTSTGHVNVGGTPDAVPYNIYSLETKAPAGKLHLNHAPSAAALATCVAVDYTATIDVKGGSEVQLVANPVDNRQKKNLGPDGNPIVIPGVAPAPAAYNGEFLQMDVVAVSTP
jgi:hypothetical protein